MASDNIRTMRATYKYLAFAVAGLVALQAAFMVFAIAGLGEVGL